MKTVEINLSEYLELLEDQKECNELRKRCNALIDGMVKSIVRECSYELGQLNESFKEKTPIENLEEYHYRNIANKVATYGITELKEIHSWICRLYLNYTIEVKRNDK